MKASDTPLFPVFPVKSSTGFANGTGSAFGQPSGMPVDMRYLGAGAPGVQPELVKVGIKPISKALPAPPDLMLVSTSDDRPSVPPGTIPGGNNGNNPPLHPTNDHIRNQLNNVLHSFKNTPNDYGVQYEQGQKMLTMLLNDIQMKLIPGPETMANPADRAAYYQQIDLIGEVAKQFKQWRTVREDMVTFAGKNEDIAYLQEQERIISGRIFELISAGGNTHDKQAAKERDGLEKAFEAKAAKKLRPMEAAKKKLDSELLTKRYSLDAMTQSLHKIDRDEEILQARIEKLKLDKTKEMSRLDPTRNTPEVIEWVERNYNNRIEDANKELMKLRQDRIRIRKEKESLQPAVDELEVKTRQMGVEIQKLEDELTVDLQLFDLEEKIRPIRQLAGEIPMDVKMPARELTPQDVAQREMVLRMLPVTLMDYKKEKDRLLALKAGKYVSNSRVRNANADLQKFIDDKKERDIAVEKAKVAKAEMQKKWQTDFDGFPQILKPYPATDVDLTGDGLNMSDLVQLLNTNRGEFNILGLSNRKGINKSMIAEALSRVNDPDGALTLELQSRDVDPEKIKTIVAEVKANQAQLRNALEKMDKNFAKVFDPNGDGYFNQVDAANLTDVLMKKLATKFNKMSKAEFAKFEAWAAENGQSYVAEKIAEARGLPVGTETAITTFGTADAKRELAGNLRTYLLIE